MAKRLEREFARYDVDALDSEEYQAMPRSLRNHAYLYLLVLTGWSRKRRTDGRVPIAVADDIARRMGQSPAPLQAALQAVGMVVPDRTDTLYITKYEKWQETAAEIAKAQSDARERQARHRANSKPPDVTPLSQNTVTRDTGTMSRVSHVTEKEIEREKEIEIASKEAMSVVARTALSVANEEPDEGLLLARDVGEFMGQQLKALEIDQCRQWLVDFAYLDRKSVMNRIREYAAKRTETGNAPIRSLGGYRFCLQSQNDWLADQGATKRDGARATGSRINNSPLERATFTPPVKEQIA